MAEKRDTDEWRKLHNVELHNPYGNADIITTPKSFRFRWAGHVVRKGDEMKEGHTSFF